MWAVTEEAVTMKTGVAAVATRVVIMAAGVTMEGVEEIGITMMEMHIMAAAVVEILTEGKKRNESILLIITYGVGIVVCKILY